MVQNVVLFLGVNSTGKAGLWETSGTAAGTFELTPIAGAFASGLSPTNLTVLKGEFLFEGKDASGHLGLWLTTGSPAGTVELTGIAGAVPPASVPTA